MDGESDRPATSGRSSKRTGRWRRLKWSLALATAVLPLLSPVGPLEAREIEGAIRGCHDPSRIIFAEDKYWIFSTAENLNLRSSSDLAHWKWESRAFSYSSGVPPWMTKYLRGVDGNGPYVDKQGRDLRIGGGTLFIGIDPNGPADRGREIGPGHVGIFTAKDRVDYLTYHFYDGDTPNGEPTLGLRTIVWGRDGWPHPGS